MLHVGGCPWCPTLYSHAIAVVVDAVAADLGERVVAAERHVRERDAVDGADADKGDDELRDGVLNFGPRGEAGASHNDGALNVVDVGRTGCMHAQPGTRLRRGAEGGGGG